MSVVSSGSANRQMLAMLFVKDGSNDAEPRLVGIPYNETFGSAETLRCIRDALGHTDVTCPGIDSITLLGRKKTKHQQGSSFGTWSSEGDVQSWQLPLNMRPADMELPGNRTLRNLVLDQVFAWNVKFAIMKVYREHE